MSETGNMDTNNISGTEDNKYEIEDFTSEYITLSELDLPSCANSEVIDSIMDLPSEQPKDRTVVENINNPESSCFNVKGPKSPKKNVQGNSTINTVPISKVIKKKGRKKKNTNELSSCVNVLTQNTPNQPDNSDLNYDMILGEDDVTADSKIIVTPSVPRKRGRPRKQPVSETNINCVSSTVQNTKLLNTNQDTSRNTKQKRQKKKNEDESNTITENKNSKKESSHCTENSISNPFSHENLSQEQKKASLNVIEINFKGEVNNIEQNSAKVCESKITISKKDSGISSTKQKMNKKPGKGSSEQKLKKEPKAKLIKKTNDKQKTTKASDISQVKKKRKSKEQILSVPTNLELSHPIDGTKSDDEDDDLCLSSLRKIEMRNVDEGNETINEQHPDITTTFEDNICTEKNNKRNVKIPTMSDFEYNLENIDTEEQTDKSSNVFDNTLMEGIIEETSKRPMRRSAKKTLHYEQESDEDPFANLESSDDEPRRGKKGSRYYSDDEYIPGMERGKKGNLSSLSKLSDSEIEDNFEFSKILKKKKFSKSPKKKDKIFEDESTEDDTTIHINEIDDDIEGSIESSMIKLNNEKSTWGSTNEFENFLVKKVGTEVHIKKTKLDSVIAPLQIPVLELNEPKKNEEQSTQTNIVSTKCASVQTDTKHEISMKNQVKLTASQSEEACEFLTNIVKTTAELGQLMTQKSEDFIEKKINVKNVTDTFKMDYCVKKSFLLFKLAKHNLIQMEEDLSKQYDEFLKVQNLLQHREEQQVITPKEKNDSDSDCEIVEVIAPNPKTVFLNKELSIKIAKKPSTSEPQAKEKINTKGRHTVWINDSIMVKKVKPNQSFLAQDSRNKKPPDTRYFVIMKIVHDFFERQQALSICAPFTTTEWIKTNKSQSCYYSTEIAHDTNLPICNNINPINHIPESSSNLKNPKSLFSLCIAVLNQHIKCSKRQGLDNEEQQANIKRLSDKFCKYLCINNNKPESNVEGLTNLNTEMYHLESQSNFNIIKSLFALSLLEVQKNIMSTSNLDSKKYLKVDENHAPREDIIECNKDVNTNLAYRSESEIFVAQNKNCAVNLLLQTLCHKKILELIFKPQGLLIQSKPNMNNSHSQEKITRNIINYKVKTLVSLCVKVIQNIQVAHTNAQNETSKYVFYNPMSLLTIVRNYLNNNIFRGYYNIEKSTPVSLHRQEKNTSEVETLSRICFAFISLNLSNTITQRKKDLFDINYTNINQNNFSTVLSLRKLCYNKLIMQMEEPLSKKSKKLQNLESEMFPVSHLNTNTNINMSITINDINTVSEDFFNNDYNSYNEENDLYDDDTHCGLEEGNDESHSDIDRDNCENNYEEGHPEHQEWVSHIKMGELRSCIDTSNNIDNTLLNTNQEFIQSKQVGCVELITNIKIEPHEDICEISSELTNIKSEPLELATQSLTLTNVVTKAEQMFHEGFKNGEEPVDLQSGNSYDVDAFEAFVSSNKLMHEIGNSSSNAEDEIYSQSYSRIRRLYEPDIDSDVDNFAGNMDLLVPQSIEQAKDRLMDSSSDDEGKNKKNDKRKYIKKKGKLKKNIKEILPLKNKQLVADDVAMLTKKMKDKIRQEDKHENENLDVPLIFRKDKDKKDTKTDQEVGDIDSDKKEISAIKESVERAEYNEIQCNDVDSTENLEIRENNLDLRRSRRKNIIDADTVSSEKNDINDAIMNDTTNKNSVESRLHDDEKPEKKCDSQLNLDAPIEMLECEPTLPVFDNQDSKNDLENYIPQSWNINENDIKESDDKSENMTVRNGWKCYSIDHTDTKLYQYACVALEKLPESFVETYMKYIQLDKDEDDIEINRLTNLQTLNRSQAKDNYRPKPRSKTAPNDISKYEVSIKIEPEDKGNECNELSASEDENDYNEELPLIEETNTENDLAKSSLMDDNESDSENTERSRKLQENKGTADVAFKVKRKIGPKSKCKVEEEKIIDSKGKIKKEVVDSNDEIKTEEVDSKDKIREEIVKVKVRIGPASKVKKEENGNSILLTADRMMNSELAQLHAPIDNVHEPPVIVKDSSKKQNTKNPNKSSSKDHTTTVHIRKDDDSSSEEEKQWVTTKEKLLKRLEKKQENNIDDAKRAKIISEYIEKRVEGPTTSSLRVRPRRPRSNKKLLERRKQMKVLARELFGDDSQQSRKYSQSVKKGRRNIRKVLDKKSLARSTVLANMEEFERKQRLAVREARLREALECEEDVNVVVINDELCLEYDFENNQPGVTVHPFFTRVMKAHQYEGVKFMWDACFETVETVQRGGGGGCILAHCMGLGKTLQVLALLHTVLTHPGVGMRRVLVCCPLSTVLNWVDEIHKWIGPVTAQIKVFELSKLKKTYERAYQLEDWYSGGGIFIIGYELFRSLTTLDPMLDDIRPTIVNKIRTALLDPGPDIIICDEGHLLKNDMSVLAVAMSRVATKRRIVLTGTPMQNNLREYYCMVNFIKPHLLGTYPEYSNRFENPIMNGQHRDSQEDDIKLMKTRTHILHKVLEGCLQRQEASVLYPYLPKKYEYTVFISMTTCQWDLYKHYIETYSRGSNKQSVLKDFHILQKIWSHPQVLHNFQTRAREVEGENKIKAEKMEDELAREDLAASEDMKPNPTDVWWLQYLGGGQMLEALDSSHKFLVVFRLLDECVALGDKVLIFSTSLYILDALEYFLRRINNWSLGKEYYRLDGSVPAEVRQKWCREFNSERNTDTKLFLISTRAGCLGLNMTAANRVIILDTSWNPAHDIQSIFRVYRFGQKKDCYVYRLVALGTMEQKMYERSVTKQAVACRVVDEQQIDRHYNMAELSELYRYDEEGCSVEAGLAAGVRDAALLRVAAALRLSGAMHAVREHDSLLRDTDARLPEDERAAAWQQFQQEHVDPMNQQVPVKMPKKFQVNVKNQPTVASQPVNNIKTETETPTPPQMTPTQIAPPQMTPTQIAPTQVTPAKPKRGRPRKYKVEASTKRGRPRKYKVEASTSQSVIAEPPGITTLNQTKERSMVDKIREILIEHQVTNAEPRDVAYMIGEVRKYIDSGSRSNVNASPVIQSIAKVLLQQSAGPPPLTNVYPDQRGCQEPESILGDSPTISHSELDNEPLSDSSELDDEPLMDTKRRKQIDEDYVPDFPLGRFRKGRKRRSRVLAMERKKLMKTVINLPVLKESGNSNQTDFAPPKGKRGRKRKSDQTISKKPSVVQQEIQQPVQQAYAQNFEDDGVFEDSILLSDDEPATTQPDPEPEIETINTDSIDSQIEIHKDPESVPEEEVLEILEDDADDEVIPLPKSLLSDEKFIKLVAHMYVSGNPILDEDAALLAAQYSTSRARDEVERTGKDICTGRLHEIAIKIFGKERLKKLHKATTNRQIQKNMTQLSAVIENFNSNATPDETAVKESSKKLSEKTYKKKSIVKSKGVDEKSEKCKSSEEAQEILGVSQNATPLTVPLLAPPPLTPAPVAPISLAHIRLAPAPLTPAPLASAPIPLAHTPMATAPLAPIPLAYTPLPHTPHTLTAQDYTLRAPTPQLPAPSEPPLPVSGTGGVVPVGMFKGPTKVPSDFGPASREESILPDDEVCLIPDAPNTMLSAILSKPQKKMPVIRRNAKQLVINSVLSANPNTSTPKVVPIKPQVTPKPPTLVLKASKLGQFVSNGKMLLPKKFITVSGANQSKVIQLKMGSLIAASPNTIGLATSEVNAQNVLRIVNAPSEVNPSAAPKPNEKAKPQSAMETISLDSDDEDVSAFTMTEPAASANAPVPQSKEKREYIRLEKKIDDDIVNSLKFRQEKKIYKEIKKKEKVKKDETPKSNKKDKTPEQTADSTEAKTKDRSNDGVPVTSPDLIISESSEDATFNDPATADLNPSTSAAKSNINVNTPKDSSVKTTDSLTNQSAPNKDVSEPIKNKDTTNSKPKTSKGNDNSDLDMINLTDSEEEQAPPKAPKLKKLKLAEPITGTSKSIIITNVGKVTTIKSIPPSKSVDLTGGEVIQVTNVTAAASGKRPPKQEAGGSKKKKKVEATSTRSNSLMSLRNFNFDDFDDIIELE